VEDIPATKITEAKERLLQADEDYEKAFSSVSQGIIDSFLVLNQV